MGCEPPEGGFRHENLQERADAFPLREAVVDWEGPVTIEAYTVAHQRGRARIARMIWGSSTAQTAFTSRTTAKASPPSDRPSNP